VIDPKYLAQRALAEVAKGSLKNHFFETDTTGSIYESILKNDLEEQVRLIDTYLKNGLTLDFFYGSIAPIIAEKLGDAWKEDTLSLSEVTIALGKLRLVCQEFEQRYFDDTQKVLDGPNVLLLTLEEDNHTFGAYLAAIQLRKSNFNAHLAIGYSESELLNLLEFGKFELIGVSVGSEKTIKRTNEIVRIIKKKYNIPVIAGGSYVNHNMEMAKRVLEVDGIEFNPEDLKSHIRSI
jgi:hypothetical protein